MDLPGTLAVFFIFGGGSLLLLSRTPIGQAIADRIRGVRPEGTQDPAVIEELERLLSRQRETGRVGDGANA